jgi:4'-phosphopantetheinyl transferase
MDRLPRLWLLPFGPVAAIAPLLSPLEQAWSETLPAAAAGRYRTSRTLLRLHLADVLECPPAVVPLHSPPGRPPQLEAGAGWVSLSHAVDALLLAWSPWPIGVDLESVDRRFDAAALQQRFFPRREQQQLGGLEGEALRLAVLRSWVHKEAAIKWHRGSLALDLRHWCFDHATATLQDGRDDGVPELLAGKERGWLWAAAGRAVRRAVLE